ncbi:MAG: DevR family CRISPR-associated autoregulator [Pyrobaculum sp.]|jgi:CRISPR-associated protein Csa2|nr:DevR family CRISPR-associated autoregulator [Pyrobaculum sp.]
MFVSFGFRFRVEVEALNMAEAVGNYARHRVAPVLIQERDEAGRLKGYRITTAPAVSGQSVAFGYMSALVKLAEQRKLPVCEECRSYEHLGGFFKRADRVDVGYDERIKTCVVEDLTGFMATKERGEGGKGAVIRRTSPVMFSYMVPDATSARGVLMPQLHVRYNLENPDKQVPYQVEAGTAVYIHGVAIDVERIGRLEDGRYIDTKDRLGRIELALDALKALYGGLLFGAKKARYLPVIEALGGIAAASHPMPFVVSPPRLGDYVGENINRAGKFGAGSIKLFCFDKEGVTGCGKQDGAEAADSLEDLVDKVKAAVAEMLKR